jgi:hypothetical protein
VILVPVSVYEHISPDPDPAGDMCTLPDDRHSGGHLITLLPVDRHIVAIAKPHAGADDNILNDDHPVKHGARPNPCVVHHHTIAHNRAGRDIDPR